MGLSAEASVTHALSLELCRVGMESTELGARDIHFPGTWNLGALDALLLLDGIWVSFLLRNVDLSI